MSDLIFKINCEDYRTIDIPMGEESKARIGTLFAKIEDLPESLSDWMEVNPRIPKYNKGSNLSGAVARSIVNTLEEEPDVFSLRNLGIYILVDSVESKRLPGDKHEVKIKLSDSLKHGIVNGGHTFAAIRQVLDQGIYPGGAYVRLHLYVNIPEESIVELAEGLNRNLQVDDASLINLVNKFDLIKDKMNGKKGADQIAYADGQPGKIHILDVLHVMTCFDLEYYPGNSRHPNDVFGSKQKILKRYCYDIDELGENSPYRKLISGVDKFLELSEEIQKVLSSELGALKIKGTEDNNRVASSKHKRDAIFTNGAINGLIPQGWLYPLLSAFRACLSRSKWDEGEIVWLMEPKDLLDEIKSKLADVIKEQHSFNKGKPGEVGRKSTAYDQCYAAAFMALAVRGKIEISEDKD